MRFRRTSRPEPYRDTLRKRAAFLRKQRLEREALPLFAEAVAARQHDVDAEMARRTLWWGEAERARRSQCAAGWRRAPARLFALDAALRGMIRSLWRTCPYPGDPSYFADLLHQIAVGRVDPLGGCRPASPVPRPQPSMLGSGGSRAVRPRGV